MTPRLRPARSDQQFARALDKPIGPLPSVPALDPNQPWSAQQPSRRKRVVRCLIIFVLGVAATMAWQSYGETAREMLANSYPQLGWLAPQTAAAETAPETVSQDSPATPAAAAESEDLKSILDSLSAVRESVDQLAAQIAANQNKMASDIAELKAAEQDIFQKISSAPPPRPAAAPARKPVAAAAPPPQPSAR